MTFLFVKVANKNLKIQEHALRILHNDYDSVYSTLLNISKKVTLELKQLRLSALEFVQNIEQFKPYLYEGTLPKDKVLDT